MSSDSRLRNGPHIRGTAIICQMPLAKDTPTKTTVLNSILCDQTAMLKSDDEETILPPFFLLVIVSFCRVTRDSFQDLLSLFGLFWVVYLLHAGAWLASCSINTGTELTSRVGRRAVWLPDFLPRTNAKTCAICREMIGRGE